MGYRHYKIQLKGFLTGQSIITAGGTVHVAIAGSPDKQTIYSDAIGTVLANPLVPVRGMIEFWTLDTVATVDLYGISPAGHAFQFAGVAPSGNNELVINTGSNLQMLKIPFSIADSVAATEKDTGFDIPSSCYVLDRLHGLGLLVTTLESGKTIDVGLGEVNPAESGGDANGFIAASSLTTAVLVIATNGALFSTNAPHRSDSVTAKSITYTLSSASAAAKGFILIPYMLAT